MNRIRLSLITLGVIGTSLSAAWIVNGVETDMEHPLQPPVRSIENGGNVPAIDAYEDGVGVFMKGSPGSDATQIDNSAFNRLVFKYGPAAKANGISIFDQVLSGTNTPPATPEDIALANIIKGNTIASDFFADGTECDDQNPDTLNDIYTDGICMGTYINGTPCDDGNSETINDVYNGGICSGICDDGNPDTADSLQEDGTCLYQFIDGVACDDGDPSTFNEIYLNGVCQNGTYFKSCKEILDNGNSIGNGVYDINPTGNNSFQVYCDMTTDGGGWTILANNSGRWAVMTSSHIPRPTAYGPFVGNSGINNAVPYNNWSINAEGILWKEFVFASYVDSFDNVVAYSAFKFNNDQGIPTTETWYKQPAYNNYIISDLGDKNLYCQTSGFKYIGVLKKDTSVSVSLAATSIPVFAMSEQLRTNSTTGDTYLIGTMSFSDYIEGSTGMDDWQDGSGCSDNWYVNGVKNSYRNAASYIMVR